MHGQFYKNLEIPSVDEQKSLVWLFSTGLKEQTKFNNSSPRSSIQYASLSSQEEHKATN